MPRTIRTVIEVPTRFGVIRPRLLPTAATVVAVVILLNLAAWQVRRHEHKNRHQPAMEAAALLAETALTAGSDLPPLLFRKVTLRGSFVPPLMLEGGRTRDYQGGYGVLQPFETTDGLRVLVDRGEVHREGMEAVLDRLGGQTGVVTLRGQLRPLPDGEPRGPVAGTADPPIWAPRGLVGIHAHVAGIAPGAYVRLGSPLAPDARARPDPDGDPDLAVGYVEIVADNSSAHYAKQWAAIAAVAMLLWLWGALDRSGRDARLEDVGGVEQRRDQPAGAPDDPE